VVAALIRFQVLIVAIAPTPSYAWERFSRPVVLESASDSYAAA
jgi:hypothetical protein